VAHRFSGGGVESKYENKKTTSHNQLHMPNQPTNNPTDPNQPPYVQRLQKMIATPSVSKNEHAVADYLQTELQSLGFNVERYLNNLWTQFGDAPSPTLLLNSHIDTVPAGNNWSADPHNPIIRDNHLFGLGSNDAGASVTCLIEAAHKIHTDLNNNQPLGGRVILALTSEEENTGKGLGEILPKLPTIEAAIIGEPTELIPMTAQRGLLILKCTAKGKTSHPANTPADSPANAIHTAARDILTINQFDWGPPHPLLGQCHAHTTMINAGTARNVVPDQCEFWIDIRTTPNQPHHELAKKIADALKSEIHIHSHRLVPVETKNNERIVRAAVQATGNQPQGSRAMSDMVFLPDTPAVKIGPGVSNRSHTPDEFIKLDELATGVETYAQLIRYYFNDDL
jgi:acetylornithine deacetylase